MSVQGIEAGGLKEDQGVTHDGRGRVGKERESLPEPGEEKRTKLSTGMCISNGVVGDRAPAEAFVQVHQVPLGARRSRAGCKEPSKAFIRNGEAKLDDEMTDDVECVLGEECLLEEDGVGGLGKRREAVQFRAAKESEGG